MKKYLTYIQLALGMSIYGSGTPVSKIVTEAFPVYIGSGLRMFFAALVLIPFVFIYRKNFKQFSKGDYIKIGMMGFSAMFLFTIFMMYGMKYVTGVIGSIIMGTSPAVTAIGSLIFLKEHMNLKKWIAIILAVAGILIVNIGGSSMHMGTQTSTEMIAIGSLLVFAAVCFGAAYTIIGKKEMSHIRPMLIVSLSVIVAAILFIPFSLSQLSEFNASAITTGQWLAVIWWGVGSIALGLSLWNFGIEKVTGIVAAGFMGFMTISSLVLSYILLNEQFFWHQMLGFIVVFISLIMLTWSPKPKTAVTTSAS
ncbi:MAG: DMT family transporter [Ignavibacteria bacterium]